MIGRMWDPVAEWHDTVLNSPSYLKLASGDDETFWEQCSASYMQNRTSGTHFKRVINWLADKTGPATSLIEIGPGPGVFTRFLTTHCAQVTAVEPSPANAVQLRRELSGSCNLTVMLKNWEDVALDSHDMVFSAGTLYVFPDIEGAVMKMIRHARKKILLVMIDEEQALEQQAANALGIQQPAPTHLSILFTEVLNSLNLSFTYDRFSEDAEYVYPNFDVLFELWKGNLEIGREHLPELKVFFSKQGLYTDNQPAVKVPRRFTTYLIEIAV